MEIIRKKEALPALATDSGIIRETALQLQKDFLSYSILLWEDEEQLPETWDLMYSGLHPVVEQLVDQDTRRLLQIIYRLDLSESLLRESLGRESGEQAIAEITVMMIHRACLKVKFRRQYSSKSDKEKGNDEQTGRIET
jgi:hypothetical protein